MTRTDGLPRRVYPRNGRYYYVTRAGKWLPLTRGKTRRLAKATGGKA